MALLYVGLAVCVAAMALWVWAKVRLGAQYSPCSDSLVANQLVDTGPYRYIRHPIYVAILGWILGCFDRHGCGVIVVNFASFSICYTRHRRQEERMLAQAIPAYTEYMTRTGAFPCRDPERRLVTWLKWLMTKTASHHCRMPR